MTHNPVGVKEHNQGGRVKQPDSFPSSLKQVCRLWFPYLVRISVNNQPSAQIKVQRPIINSCLAQHTISRIEWQWGGIKLGERSLPILRKSTFPFIGLTTGSVATSPWTLFLKYRPQKFTRPYGGRYSLSNRGWICLCWAVTPKKEYTSLSTRPTSRLLMLSMPDRILLRISSAWSSNCLYCETPHLSVWINAPTCLRGGEVIYLCLSLNIDWDLDGIEQAESLFLSPYPSSPKHQHTLLKRKRLPRHMLKLYCISSYFWSNEIV